MIPPGQSTQTHPQKAPHRPRCRSCRPSGRNLRRKPTQADNRCVLRRTHRGPPIRGSQRRRSRRRQSTNVRSCFRGKQPVTSGLKSTPGHPRSVTKPSVTKPSVTKPSVTKPTVTNDRTAGRRIAFPRPPHGIRVDNTPALSLALDRFPESCRLGRRKRSSRKSAFPRQSDS